VDEGGKEELLIKGNKVSHKEEEHVLRHTVQLSNCSMLTVYCIFQNKKSEFKMSYHKKE
jgi:hypothetical protein